MNIDESTQFEWDSNKRAATLEKHGLDFVDAIKIFCGPILQVRSLFEGEERWLAVGLVRGIEITVIYTVRCQSVRVFTVRRSRKNEREKYYAYVFERSQ